MTHILKLCAIGCLALCLTPALCLAASMAFPSRMGSARATEPEVKEGSRLIKPGSEPIGLEMLKARHRDDIVDIDPEINVNVEVNVDLSVEGIVRDYRNSPNGEAYAAREVLNSLLARLSVDRTEELLGMLQTVMSGFQKSGKTLDEMLALLNEMRFLREEERPKLLSDSLGPDLVPAFQKLYDVLEDIELVPPSSHFIAALQFMLERGWGAQHLALLAQHKPQSIDDLRTAMSQIMKQLEEAENWLRDLDAETSMNDADSDNWRDAFGLYAQELGNTKSNTGDLTAIVQGNLASSKWPGGTGVYSFTINLGNANTAISDGRMSGQFNTGTPMSYELSGGSGSLSGGTNFSLSGFSGRAGDGTRDFTDLGKSSLSGSAAGGKISGDYAIIDGSTPIPIDSGTIATTP